MSPLDDQLRAALHGRADVLTPSPDPFAGIEARARGMRRRRVIASVTGAALAVAAIAVVLPSINRGTSSTGPAPMASSPTVVARSGYDLDPAKPWSYRGTDAATGNGNLDTFQRKWELKHPGSRITPLFGQVYEPTAKAEIAFVASGGSDGARYGFVQAGEPGPELLYDQPLGGGTGALAFALPGDEGAERLVVVAAPGVKRFLYAGDGTAYAPMTSIGDGVAIAALEGRTAVDQLRVTAPDGTVLLQGDAPGGGTPTATTPANVLASWPQRGQADRGPSTQDVVSRFTRATGRAGDADKARYRALYTGSTDSGVKYTFGQAWFEGDQKAHTVGLATGRTGGPEFFFGPPTPADPPVLAFVVSNVPGALGELLVVVPTPRTGQVQYDRDSVGDFTSVTGQDPLEGVVVIDRTAGDTDDRLRVLNGNGDFGNPNYVGPVLPLLCGNTECG